MWGVHSRASGSLELSGSVEGAGLSWALHRGLKGTQGLEWAEPGLIVVSLGNTWVSSCSFPVTLSAHFMKTTDGCGRAASFVMWSLCWVRWVPFFCPAPSTVHSSGDFKPRGPLATHWCQESPGPCPGWLGLIPWGNGPMPFHQDVVLTAEGGVCAGPCGHCHSKKPLAPKEDCAGTGTTGPGEVLPCLALPGQ